jgi:hypothetical protein
VTVIGSLHPLGQLSEFIGQRNVLMHPIFHLGDRRCATRDLVLGVT